MSPAIKKLVLATNNKNKIKEIENLLLDTGIEIVKVKDDFNPKETGKNFQENAYIKAFEAAKIMNLPALADDSGLVIDTLGGLPGIHSARFAESDPKRIERVLSALKYEKPENKAARFICAMVIVSPNGEILHSCTGTCEGYITDKPLGEQGFGYDPIFYIPELDATMAQLSLEEKNKVSHRAKALRCTIDWLKSSN